jgi:hypothetical protein
LGIGPSMSGFTVVVQNSAPIRQLGVATSTLTFLRQVGGSVGLAISGTVFSQSFAQKLPQQLIANGVPRQVVSNFGKGSSTGGQGSLTGVSLAAQLAHTLPKQLQPLIPRIVTGVHDAFSLAIGGVFWLTVAAGILALLAVIMLPDLTLRGQARASGQMADTIPGGQVPAEGGTGAVAQ